jgi:1-deoxy-D-xylulose-5-phosphate reductoisomerase
VSRRVAVLGATGSIGRQTLEVLERESEHAQAVGLAAGHDLDGLVELARRVRPSALALETASDPKDAKSRLESASPGARVWVGDGAASAWFARRTATRW